MQIFAQLGADSSLLYQFLIMLVVLIASKFLFLNHLENILVTREAKTVKLQGSADKQLEEVEKLQAQYKAKMSAAQKEVRLDTENKKVEVSKSYEKKYKEAELIANEEVSSKRKEAQRIAAEQKDAILANADELSKLLVEKVTKG